MDIGWVPTRYHRKKVTNTGKHFKNYSRKIRIGFMFSSQVSGLEEVCPEGEIGN